MSNIRIAPTLATMDVMYRLSREGGNKSERFLTYVKRVEHEWGLVQYNPMAGSAAQETVQGLLAIDAETIASHAAANVSSQCKYDDPITLAISVRSKGLWTDRVGTEVDDRLNTQPRIGFGIISLWSREENSESDIVRESAAATVRVMWHAIHGAADTLKRVFAREGLAYALAGQVAPIAEYNADPTDEETVQVMQAVEILGDSRAVGDIAATLFGDDVATTMGWSPLGIPNKAGYRWAAQHAKRVVSLWGAVAALRMNVEA